MPTTQALINMGLVSRRIGTETIVITHTSHTERIVPNGAKLPSRFKGKSDLDQISGAGPIPAYLTRTDTRPAAMTLSQRPI